MDFNLTEEQKILKDTSRKFLQRECPIELVKEIIKSEKGYSKEIWTKIADLGWTGILLDEKYAGIGATFFDCALILEEMGRVLFPSPFLADVVMGGTIIQDNAQTEMKNTFLPMVSSGELIITIALMEKEASYHIGNIRTVGAFEREGYKLNGTKMFVPNANISQYVICPFITNNNYEKENITLSICDTKSEGIKIRPLKTFSNQAISEVNFVDYHVPQENVIGEKGRGKLYLQDLWPKAVAGKCCEMLGAMEYVFEMTLNYIQERQQFGRPLSSFQVIQHYCADMAIDMECSRFITRKAAWNVSQDLPDQKKDVSMAKAWISQAYKNTTELAHQMHGAMGFTEELQLQLYFKHAKASEIELGDSMFHRLLVFDEMDI